jgi:hypothetical protein
LALWRHRLSIQCGLLDLRLAAADRDDLAAGLDDLVRDREHEVDAFLMHETRHQPKDRTARQRQAELLADVIGDLLGIGFADGGQMGCIDDAAFEERNLVVEFEAFDMKGMFRRTDPAQRFPGEQALISQVVDGQDGRYPDRVQAR